MFKDVKKISSGIPCNFLSKKLRYSLNKRIFSRMMLFRMSIHRVLNNRHQCVIELGKCNWRSTWINIVGIVYVQNTHFIYMIWYSIEDIVNNSILCNLDIYVNNKCTSPKNKTIYFSNLMKLQNSFILLYVFNPIRFKLSD